MKSIKVKKYNLYEILIVIIIQILFFQTPLQEKYNFFQMFDEIVSVIAILFILYSLIFKGIRLVSNEIICTLCLLFIIFLGVIYSKVYSIQTNLNAIITDIGIFIKFFAAYLWVRISNSKINSKKILLITAKLIKLYIIVTFLFGIINLFYDIGMSYDIRYGVRSFEFIHGHPGILSIICVGYLMFLTYDLKYNNNNKFYIFITLIILIMTLRTTSFGIVILYIMINFFLFSSKKVKLNWYYIPIIGGGIFLTGKTQIINYFTVSDSPRSILLRHGIKIMKDYFPFGSGLATYGSYSAKKYYSPLYSQFGFNSYYGMGINEGGFLTDNFWPMLFAEFGFIGLILFILFLINFIGIISKKCSDKYLKAPCLFCFFYLLVASLASPSFVHYTSVLLMIIIGLMINCNIDECKIKLKGEE